MRKIKNKNDFYKNAAVGLCGNTMRTWSSVKEYWPYRLQYPQVGLRRTIINHKDSFARIPWEQLISKLDIYDIKEGTYIISEIPDPDIEGKNGLQGELTWGSFNQGLDAGFIFYYTRTLGYMRQRLRESGRTIYGFEALNLIECHCDDSDYEMLMSFFDYYSDVSTGDYPVIEFAIMNKSCGILNRRLVIWEIRNGY
jgi:hypothetical protein